MGKRKLWGVMLIVTALVMMQLPVSEADAAASASDFQMNGSTLVKYVGTDTAVTVPGTVEKIGRSAFEDNDRVQSIILPESVKTIEEYAFWGCDRLKTVTLGKGLTEVGDYVFANCKGLTSMTIPSNIRGIGIYAFEDCVNLTDITIPPQVIRIHETSFDGCYKLVIHAEEGSYADRYAEGFAARQAEMPEYEDVPGYPEEPEIVITVPDETVVPENPGANGDVGEPVVREEGTLLGSTRIVGNRAVVFIDNTSPTVLDSTKLPQMENRSDAIGYTSDGTLAKYTIVDGRIVADQAYYRSTALGEVALPDTIEEIGQFAFARSSLTGIVLPEGLRTVSYGAFYHCDGLDSVELPASVETIEPKAFTYTRWMEQFLAGGEEYLISGNVLVAYNGTDAQAVVPEGVAVIAAEAFRGKEDLVSVVLPDSLTVIGEAAFENCVSLEEVHFGQKLRKIGDRAFAGCALGEVELPQSLTEQGLKAFDSGVRVQYDGLQPAQTHEVSAERLSNESYRDLSPESGMAGVEVVGIPEAFAQLSGASRVYTLKVTGGEDAVAVATLRRGLERALASDAPQSIAYYELQLTDNSGIPITKLGRQELTVLLPLEERLQNQNLKVVALDRNGQLETVQSERVLVEGEEYLRFGLHFLSALAIYGDGTAYEGDAVVEEQVTMESLSAGPVGDGAGDPPGSQEALRSVLVPLKWGLGAVLLLGGCWLLFARRKTE